MDEKITQHKKVNKKDRISTSSIPKKSDLDQKIYESKKFTTDLQKLYFYRGVDAIESGNWQLAYDIYYTWIHKSPIVELDGFDLNDLNSEKLNPKYINKHNEAYIHNNFAYVCSAISETYEDKSKRKEAFHKTALCEMREAIKLSPKTASFYSTYGDILCEGVKDKWRNGIRALNQYRIYEKHAKDEEKIDSLREISQILIWLLTWKYMEENDSNLHDLIENNEECSIYYNEFLKKIEKYRIDSIKYYEDKWIPDSEEKKQWEKWDAFFELMEHVNGVDDCLALKEVQCLLLIIDETVSLIVKDLQWKKYGPNKYILHDKELDDCTIDEPGDSRPVAYYTTLRTVQHIFEKLYQTSVRSAPHEKDEKSKGEGKNCMTIMHSKYMNDPDEGLTLLNVFADEIDEQVKRNINNVIMGDSNQYVIQNVIWGTGTDEFRENIFNNYNVFLKSFTEKEDDLIMWNRYASDYSDGGRDSNGCYVKLNAEMYANIVNDNESGKIDIKKKHDFPDDNLHLHRVVYLSHGKIETSKNPDLPIRVKKYYDALKRMMCELNSYLCRRDIRTGLGEDWDDFVSCLKRFLQQSMRFIIFYFKEDTYADELESRLVFTRESDQQGLIYEISGYPGKLCINPFYQIYIDKIILGPNVTNEGLWEPYFEYQLNDMWKNHPDLKKDSKKRPQEFFEVTKSKKHYRTFGKL